MKTIKRNSAGNNSGHALEPSKSSGTSPPTRVRELVDDEALLQQLENQWDSVVLVDDEDKTLHVVIIEDGQTRRFMTKEEFVEMWRRAELDSVLAKLVADGSIKASKNDVGQTIYERTSQESTPTAQDLNRSD